MPWIVRATPYDPLIPGETSLYFSDIGLMTRPTDAVPDTYYEKRLNAPFQVRTALYSGSYIGGRSDASFGSIRLANNDGGLDHLANYDWDGRLIEVSWTPTPNPVLPDFSVVFSGTAERLVLGDTIEIELRDLQVLLDKPYQIAKYLGTGSAEDGGQEGPPSYKDRRKPRLVGVCRNFQPVPIHFKKFIFQYNNGPVGSVLAVRDGGYALTAGADHPNYAALLAATVDAGTYATCRAEGLIRIGTAPGVLTMDAEGAAPSGYALLRFADIAQWVIDTDTDISAGDFAAGAIASMNALCPQVVGYWFDGSGGENVRGVIDFLAQSIGAYYGFNDSRKIVFGRLDAPTGTAAFSFTDADFLSLRPLPVARRLKSQNIKFRRHWRPLSDSEVVGTITGAAKTDFTRQWREVTRTDAATAAASLLAREEKMESALDAEADAIAEADRRIALFGPRRRAFAGTVPFTPGLTAGVEVRLQSSRHGLSDGSNFIVVMADRDSVTETHDIEVWG
ncbi:hypothetical protein [Falsiroseomonas sp. CW058]|uniref:hypothetical protein n=1 Tax=Falsiroseomonas sp. CW058 TaxID=3388664 RepID=UPI003D311BBE